jgi:hypothetical protein
MSTISSIRLILSLVAVFAWGTIVPQAGAAAKKPNVTASAATAKTPTAAVGIAKPQPVVIPRSTFEVPKSPKEGRDPFFPDSLRPFGALGVRTNAPATPAVLNFALKGLAGPAGAQFATISLAGTEGAAPSVNLAVGEEGELVTPAKRVKVRCLEIKEDLVVIEADGVRRELHWRRAQ